MRCPNCTFDSPAGMKFCGQCGQALPAACPQCGFINPSGFAFCGQCATQLSSAAPASAAVSPVEPGRPAERRHMTVMFCDLVGSTYLSGQLDPEELRHVMRAYQQRCSDVVRRYEGHVAQYLGDGVLIYFGYPTAHEDASRRAVHAGLEIVESMAELRENFDAPKEYHLATRVGIHAGLVVVGEIGGREGTANLALGETPNVAARVQSLTEPDTVLITQPVFRKVRRFFECQPRGAHQLKGVSKPVSVYRVISERTRPEHFVGAITAEITPLVGRIGERRQLQEIWERVQWGVGQGVLLGGEAGIGKSRLVDEIKEEVTNGGRPVLVCNGSPYHQNSTLYPVIELLQRSLALRREDLPEERLRRLEASLEAVGFAVPATVPPVASLLSLPLPEGYPPLDPNPRKQKQERLDTLLAWMIRNAGEGPVMVVVEDLQWVDPSTLELLSLLIDRLAQNPIFLLLTFRPDYEPPWSEGFTRIVLRRLDASQVASIIQTISGGKALPAEIIREIVAKTDGVPLFVEELTKTVIGSDQIVERDRHYELVGSPAAMTIPDTLHDSLMARLDRLSSIKGVAQLGAVIGRDFSFELIQALSPLEDEILERELARLVDAELLIRRGKPPHAIFSFKHALIRDVAYESLLKSTRQRYHEQITNVLEERFPDIVETQPELLAHHSTSAGLVERAMTYWRKAGENAIQKSANVEAIRHLSRELELLESTSEGPARIEQELSLQLALGPALMNVRGWSAPEVEHAYQRARELSGQIGDTSRTFGVLRGLWGFYFVRGKQETARDLGEDLLHLAEELDEGSPRLEAHRALGAALFPLGDLDRSRHHLERALELYDPEKHRHHAFRYGQDPGVTGRSFLSLTLSLLGLADQAVARSKEACDLARHTSHLFSLAFAQAITAMVHFIVRDTEASRRAAETTVLISTENAFAISLAWGTLFQGWALAESGETERGIEQMVGGLTGYHSAGAELAASFFVAPLIETYGRVGRIDEALAALDEALARVESANERFYEAELHRLYGDMRLAQGRRDEAEAAYRRALTAARERAARLLELRAAVSLGRLLRGRARSDEAWTLVSGVLDTFPDGAAARDIEDARRLLGELRPAEAVEESLPRRD